MNDLLFYLNPHLLFGGIFLYLFVLYYPLKRFIFNSPSKTIKQLVTRIALLLLIEFLVLVFFIICAFLFLSDEGLGTGLLIALFLTFSILGFFFSNIAFGIIMFFEHKKRKIYISNKLTLVRLFISFLVFLIIELSIIILFPNI